jgi:RNA polymerase-binding transcription factor DksA
MNVQEFKRRLLELETQLSARTERRHQAARAQVPDSPGDVGDVSVADEEESEAFTEAELDATVLQHVRDALRRIEEGTFGRCVVDTIMLMSRLLHAATGGQDNQAYARTLGTFGKREVP